MRRSSNMPSSAGVRKPHALWPGRRESSIRIPEDVGWERCTSGKTPEAREQLFLAEKDFRTFHSPVEGLERANEARRLLGGECVSPEMQGVPFPGSSSWWWETGRGRCNSVTSNAHPLFDSPEDVINVQFALTYLGYRQPWAGRSVM